MAKRSVSVTHGTESDVLTGLFRRDGRYSIKRRVPVDLVEHFGRKVIVRARGTGDPADARRLLPIAWQKLDEEFAQARAARPATDADKPVKASLEVAIRPSREYGPDDVEALSFRLLRMMRKKRAEAITAGKLEAFLEQRRDMLRDYQDILDGLEEPFTNIYHIEAARNALKWLLNGQDAPVPLPENAGFKAASHRESGPTLEEVFKRWAGDGEKKPRTVGRTEKIVADFVSLVGVKAVSEYTVQDVNLFKDALIERGQSAANVNVKIPMLGTVFHYARKRMHLIPSSPTTAVSVVDNRKAREIRRAFEEGELNILFSSRVYSEALRPKAGGGEAAYWLPLLALFTGARQTELGQLYTDDIILERYRDAAGDEAEAWVLRIVENPERGQFVKNEGSERRIPIHEEILKRGFLAYRDRMQADAPRRLFPRIEPNSVGELMGNWSKWFGRYRRSIGLVEAQTTFHSLRHTFKHYARLSGIHKEVHNEITGHETGDVSDSYGGLSYPLAPLVEAVSQFSVPGVRLPS